MALVYERFVHSASNADPVLRALVDLETVLTRYWADNQSSLIESPLGECAALAAATRVFYEEQAKR